MRRGTAAVWERHVRRTFEDAAIKYLREFDGKDISRQKYSINAVRPYIEKMRLIDIDNDSLEQFKEDRRNGSHPIYPRPAMAGTINKDLTVVSTILNRAVKRWRWLPSAPEIQRVKGAKRIAYPLTWDEQDALFKYLPDGWGSGCAKFAVNTGVRKEELFSLTWKDMVEIPNLESYVFILRETKNGHQRAVICNSLAREAVEAQRGNKSKYVFPSLSPRNKGGKIVNCGKVWRMAWEKAGLPLNPLVRKGIHNLRHTFGQRLRAFGVAQEDRNALLGHNNSDLAEHYALPDLERLARKSELVTERKDTVILRVL